MAPKKTVEATRARRDTADVKTDARAAKRTRKPKQPPPQIKAELPEPLATFVF
jgi:hypothetical protein